jgi:hypothetical protein
VAKVVAQQEAANQGCLAQVVPFAALAYVFWAIFDLIEIFEIYTMRHSSPKSVWATMTWHHYLDAGVELLVTVLWLIDPARRFAAWAYQKLPNKR